VQRGGKIARLAMTAVSMLVITVALFELYAGRHVKTDDGVAAKNEYCTVREDGVCRSCVPGRMLDAAFKCQRADCGWSRRLSSADMPMLDDPVTWVDDAGRHQASVY
jgi:hypothetical protein